MSILKILVEVPSEIVTGIMAGHYTRDAAGIIRWAKGTERAGEIVVHLREVGSDWQTAPSINANPLFPVGALMAVQVAGFVYLGYQLKQIREAISSLHHDVVTILRHVEVIRQQQWLDKLNLVAHGVEHLHDAEFRPELLDEARKSFGKARGEIRFFLQTQSPVALIENLPQFELLMQGTCISFAGEYMCLQRQRADLAEIGHVCRRYASIVSDTKRKLMEAPPVHRPPIQSSHYLRHFPEVKPLTGRIQMIEDSMSGESEFVEALARLDPAVLDGAAKSQLERSRKSVMVLYP